MNSLIKVVIVVFFLYQCDRVIGKKYIKILSFEKEHEHGVLLHHLKPISFIKETITPFGKFSFRHLIEKRDLHNRKRRDIDDVISVPEVGLEEGSKVIEEVQDKKIIPTDIILARVEFYKAKPIETISLHSVLNPLNAKQEFKIDDIITPELTETVSELEDKDIIKDSPPEPVPLSIPEETEKQENVEEHIEEKEGVNKPIEIKPVIPEIEEKLKGELSEIPEPALEVKELNEEKDEILEAEVSEPVVEKESIKEEAVELAPETSIIENRDVEVDGIKTDNVIENIEEASPDKVEPPIIAVPAEKPVEITAVPVSPLPIPVYIPLYTEIKAPVPVPAPVPTEAPVVVSEVVNIVPPVVVVTEKAAEVPPPPPVNTVTTVVETETTPSLFTRGSRFMLNISSRILKKMLRLVAMARTRLHLGSPVEE